MNSKSGRRRVELHSHTTFSDGFYEPEVLAELCAGAGVEIWALTDHDNCDGCARAAEAAARHGVEFLPGIEVSAFHDRSIHVLGYGVDPQSETLQSYSKRRLEARVERMHRMLEKLAKLGLNISFDQVQAVAGEGAIARPHLAQAMVDAGFVASKQQAFNQFIANGGPAYVETPWPSVPDAIELIHESGGIAVLAHPGIYDRDDAISDWIEAGLDGIECRHPKHDDADAARYEALADAHGVLKTGSSDFHGPNHIGENFFGKVELSVEWIEAFLERVR